MKTLSYYKLIKTALQIFLLQTILVLNMGPIGSGTAYAAAPANDNLVNAMAVTIGNSYTINDVADATIQTGEIAPTSTCDGGTLALGHNSIWFSYIPASSGFVSFDTVGSLDNGGELDTYIAVWTGDKNDISTLTMLGCDDNNEIGFTSQIGFNAQLGTTYYIQIAKWQCRLDIGCSPDTVCTGVCSIQLTIKNQTFADVGATHPYFAEIEALYAAGLTGGCGTNPELIFCPGASMSRAQSAVFMLRGNFGSSYVPVTPTHIFSDNWKNSSWGEGWAESMFIEGLTGGCGSSPLKFCPDEVLTNAQLAVFGLRLKYGNSYAPPAATGTVFADLTDVNFWGTGWAEQAYADGLMPSCGTDIGSGKPLFCPNAPVDRGFGSYVIVKAKNLLP